jgi:hypothetical protein
MQVTLQIEDNQICLSEQPKRQDVHIHTFHSLVITSISWFLPDTIPHRHLYLDVELQNPMSRAGVWLAINITAQRSRTETAVRLVGASGQDSWRLGQSTERRAGDV